MNLSEIDSLLEQIGEEGFSLRHFLFKEQIDLALDPARFATAVCSVRAGKTITCAADLIYTALSTNRVVCLYITLSRVNAKRIIWPELMKIIYDFQMEAKTNETELSIRFPNGSIIYCSGASNPKEIENFRGLSNVALVYIDESQAFRSFLKELVEDILIKRLYDTNGRLRLIGTPGPVPSGYFYEASQNPKWSHHGWTLHQNIYIEKKSGLTVSQLIAQDCERRGVDVCDPSIQRECFGKWVVDVNALLLDYEPSRNHYDTLPPGDYIYILGLDFGYEDADAYAVLGWNQRSPDTYLVEEVIEAKQTYEMMLERFNALNTKYPFSRVIADPGGGGKKLIESLKQRYPIPFQVADKLGKIANYDLLKNALRTKRFFAKKESRFAQDCLIIERDRDKSTADKIVVRGHSDIIDATLYAFKESPAYGYVAPTPPPKPGSEEYYGAIEAEIMRHHEEKSRHQHDTVEMDKEMIPVWNR